MSVESFTTAVSPARTRRARGPRLAGAEFLKLRKRRGLVLSSLGLMVMPMLVGYTVVAVQHASDPDRHGPGGGVENFLPSIGLLSGLVAIVAILIGVTAGTGDLRAGVFRELVITGRSRLSLFAARIPGGLALLLPFAAAGFVTAAVASIVLADGEPTPGFRLLVLTGAWIGLAAALTFVLALGVSSVVGSTGPSVGILVGWQLLLGPLLPALDSLGFVRDLLPGAGVTAIAPEGLEVQAGLSMTHAAIAANIALWTLVPLAAGAWRTNTRDA